MDPNWYGCQTCAKKEECDLVPKKTEGKKTLLWPMTYCPERVDESRRLREGGDSGDSAKPE